MKPRFAASSRAAVGRTSLDREKQNRCVIIPPKLVDMVAETIERRGSSWFVRTKATSDLVIRIGKGNCFHLHMLPMVSRSGYLNRMAFESRNASGNNKKSVELEHVPGGADTFELVVKFCYGWKVDLTADSAAALYCAARFLEMSDDFEGTNLISRAEAFLSFVMISSWKDTLRLLKSCQPISWYAQIEARCSEAIAWKVEAVGLGHDEAQCWWFEDVSALRIDHFIQVVAAVKKKGLKPELLGSCIAYWTARWLSFTTSSQVTRLVLESLVRILPAGQNSVPCNFLLHLLKVGGSGMMGMDAGLSSSLEARIALLLERCQPTDLLVNNYAESATLYDVRVIARVVKAYASTAPSNSSKMFLVARLVDGFLAMVARDGQLGAQDFQLLVEALPRNARYSDDNLYRAIDTYLKAHPKLAEEERKGVCRAMEYHKLSHEAREHAMKNERLPLNMTTQFILLEQLNMAQAMDYRTVIRVDAGFMDSHRELNIIKLQVERLKLQLAKLHSYKLEIKRMANVGLS